MTKPAWLIEAESHLGFTEGPNNKNPFGAHYRIPNQPWCALFVSFCCAKVGQPLPSMQSGMPDGYAGVYWGMQWAKANGFWRPSWKAEPGDVIVYGWDGPGSPSDEMHTGFIVSSGAKGATGHTIEGNRADQVERQTFTVGAEVVLGTIAVTKILARKQAIVPKPIPQPRSAEHPASSGPGSLDLSEVTAADLAIITRKLNHRSHPVPADSGERRRLRETAAAIERVLDLADVPVDANRS
jgi:hypothetical protein